MNKNTSTTLIVVLIVIAFIAWALLEAGLLKLYF